jgi:hypothetical protein
MLDFYTFVNIAVGPNISDCRQKASYTVLAD